MEEQNSYVLNDLINVYTNVLKNSEMENLNNCLFTYHELKGVRFTRSSEFVMVSNLFQDYFPPFLFVN